ncbi:MAG: hypothetical protein PHU27_11480 [Salinivirgaceae bacterium]|nr:hypothetical protein [Salinivirgaceae bacterium]MDD4747386.1 hypothetical protein [Salinivirgaceae bacterium]
MKINILEEGIPFDIQKEYLDYSHSFERGELTPKEIEHVGNLLLYPDVPVEGKKKALAILAHVGTIEAFIQISNYYKNPDNEIIHWTALALQECKMFLESELTDENVGFISTGLGGTNDKMRVYYLILPLENKSFTKKQHKTIEAELEFIGKKYNCPIEGFDFQDNYVGLTVLIPFDITIATFIENGIKSCNEFEIFVLEHYYAGNLEIPNEEETVRLIKIVREG